MYKGSQWLLFVATVVVARIYKGGPCVAPVKMYDDPGFTFESFNRSKRYGKNHLMFGESKVEKATCIFR